MNSFIDGIVPETNQMSTKILFLFITIAYGTFLKSRIDIFN